MSDISDIEVERINDMCGGYVVAKQGDIIAICRNNEYPVEAIERVKREKSSDKL